MIFLALQKYAYQRHPVPSAKERIERLARLKRVIGEISGSIC